MVMLQFTVGRSPDYWWNTFWYTLLLAGSLTIAFLLLRLLLRLNFPKKSNK